jgi:hypothetical protein
VIGLALGMLAQESGVEGILPFYAVLLLLAIPLLGLPQPRLAGLVVVGPVLCVTAAQAQLPYAAYTGSNVEPSFATLAHDPLGQLVQLLVTGEYPVVVYLAYICAGSRRRDASPNRRAGGDATGPGGLRRYRGPRRRRNPVRSGSGGSIAVRRRG